MIQVNSFILKSPLFKIFTNFVFISITPEEILNGRFTEYELHLELNEDTNFYYSCDTQCQMMHYVGYIHC
jgi:hypothetical protein